MKIDLKVENKLDLENLQAGDVIVTNDEVYILSQEYGNNSNKFVIRPEREMKMRTFDDLDNVTFKDIVNHIQNVWNEKIQEIIKKDDLVITRASK